MDKISTIILAAGLGTRMPGDHAKVLHKVNSKSLIKSVLDQVQQINPNKTVVIVGYQAEKVKEHLADYNLEFALQENQLGTAHAVLQANSHLKNFNGDCLVACGDVPFIQSTTFKELVKLHRRRDATATILTTKLEDPTGYGRIIRDENDLVTKIVEEKDASEQEKKVKEINSGTYLFDCQKLFDSLSAVDNDNAQGEYYLTDVIQILKDCGGVIAGHCIDNSQEVMGINTAEDLDKARNIAHKYL